MHRPIAAIPCFNSPANHVPILDDENETILVGKTGIGTLQNKCGIQLWGEDWIEAV